jgi:hypothetical protein
MFVIGISSGGGRPRERGGVPWSSGISQPTVFHRRPDMTTEELEDCVNETDFFLRYLMVTLVKYQEDRCEAIHDAACNLNNPDCFESYKVLDRSTKKRMHRLEFLRQGGSGRSSRDEAPVKWIGVFLIVLSFFVGLAGGLGWFAGRLLAAAVSRQRSSLRTLARPRSRATPEESSGPCERSGPSPARRLRVRRWPACINTSSSLASREAAGWIPTRPSPIGSLCWKGGWMKEGRNDDTTRSRNANTDFWSPPSGELGPISSTCLR